MSDEFFFEEKKFSLTGAWEETVRGLAGWRHFLTLTFEDNENYRHVSMHEALSTWKGLVRVLNSELYGKNHYIDYVGHSYFSYCLAVEMQVRGAIHFHALIDKPIHYELIHEWWGRVGGYVWIKHLKPDQDVVKYTVKYVGKGAVIYLFKNTKSHPLKFTPMWMVGLDGRGLDLNIIST